MYDVERALAYHRNKRPGKIEVIPTKACRTQRDLTLAYSPGVAAPCLEIQRNPDDVYEYTAKGNLVACISNGTAVLGLGNIGALAGKPVMEGKGILFKRFADIDVFDLELGTEDPDEIVKAVCLLEPTFGGVNLEDIKAPECFYIESKCKELMNIPVFHDDQHGTAIITSAALLNALEIVGKRIENFRVVVNGAGASGISCARLYIALGVRRENIFMLDTKGMIYTGRTDGMNPYKAEFAQDTKLRTLEEALEGADMFLGLSAKGALHPEWIRRMAKNPVIFALANPDPEITPNEALAVRDDCIVATGRSDYPNQVNNVLGFPYIFRGALDVRARNINEEMKLAAVRALADLAREEVPESVSRAYSGRRFHFGREYLIPTPFDPRVILWVAPAVAQAAIDTGVAGIKTLDKEKYIERLEVKLGPERHLMRTLLNQAAQVPKRIVFPEGDHPSVLRAVHLINEEGIAQPVLLGDEERIRARAKDLFVDLDGATILDRHFQCEGECSTCQTDDPYVETLFQLRARKGVTRQEACRLLQRDRTYVASVMVARGEADGMVNGVSTEYRDAIRPAIQVLGIREGTSVICGVYAMLFADRMVLFADCTVNIEPNAEELAEIASMTTDLAKFLGINPRVAMLSFSNFGSTPHPNARKMAEAAELLRLRRPDVAVDGEMMASTAIDAEYLQRFYPFNRLGREANVLIFPNLESANIAYKLLAGYAKAQAIGPLLMGLRKPFNVVRREADSEEILYLTALTVCRAQGLLAPGSYVRPASKP